MKNGKSCCRFNGSKSIIRNSILAILALALLPFFFSCKTTEPAPPPAPPPAAVVEKVPEPAPVEPQVVEPVPAEPVMTDEDWIALVEEKKAGADEKKAVALANNADTAAADIFANAEDTYIEAEAAFEDGDFEDAANKFTESGELFSAARYRANYETKLKELMQERAKVDVAARAAGIIHEGESLWATE